MSRPRCRRYLHVQAQLQLQAALGDRVFDPLLDRRVGRLLWQGTDAICDGVKIDVGSDSEDRFLAQDRDNRPHPGRWYHAGIDRTCRMLESIGYSIVDPDVGTCHRDPILHFVRP